MFGLVFRCLGSLVPLVTDLLGVAYPCLSCAKASIQEDVDASSQWLTYWVVYAAVKSFESLGEWVISWVPMYPEVKLAFVCWLVLPRFQGAHKIYDSVVKPYFLEYEEEIDTQLLIAQREARKHVWTFSIYLLTEGSKVAGEKTMAAVSLFLRVAGLSSSSTLGGDEMAVVADAMGKAVESGLGGVADKTVPQSGSLRGSDRARDGGKDEEGTADGKGGVTGDAPICAPIDAPSEAPSEAPIDAPDGSERDCCSDDEFLTAEEEGLLVDFLNIMNDGVYLNVSTMTQASSAQHSVPLLRIVTLSDDRWRLLWTNLRDLRNRSSAASSLHLCTVTAHLGREGGGTNLRVCAHLGSHAPPRPPIY
jgi:hypothetical protein